MFRMVNNTLTFFGNVTPGMVINTVVILKKKKASLTLNEGEELVSASVLLFCLLCV